MQTSDVAKLKSTRSIHSETPEHAPKNRDQGQFREQQLISNVRAGNVEAFYALIAPHLRYMQNLVRPMLPNPADAEDIVQDAVMTAFTKIRQLRSPSSFRPWLLQIAVNEARMKRRSSLRVRTESLSEPTSTDSNETRGDLIPAHPRETPFFEAENRQVRGHLRKALGSIPLMYREAFVLREIHELTVEQAAEILRLKPPTLQTRLRRARALLKSKLLALWDCEFLHDQVSLV